MFDIHRKEIIWGGRQLVLESGRLARQADDFTQQTRVGGKLHSAMLGIRTRDVELIAGKPFGVFERPQHLYVVAGGIAEDIGEDRRLVHVIGGVSGVEPVVLRRGPGQELTRSVPEGPGHADCAPYMAEATGL